MVSKFSKLFTLLLFLTPIILSIYIEFKRQYYENVHGAGSYIHDKNKFYGWIQMFNIILFIVSIYGLYYSKLLCNK